MLEFKMQKIIYFFQTDTMQKQLSTVIGIKSYYWFEMKVNSTIFWTILIVIITETIGAKYLLVAVDITRDVGMYFTLLQELNTSRSHKRFKTIVIYVWRETKFKHPGGLLSFLFLTEAPRQNESPEELCTCGYYSWRDKFGAWHNGCKIDDPTPPGYRCYCYFAFISTCDGKGLKCKSEIELGCNGCKERECCIGNCDGYPDRNTTMKIINA